MYTHLIFPKVVHSVCTSPNVVRKGRRIWGLAWEWSCILRSGKRSLHRVFLNIRSGILKFETVTETNVQFWIIKMNQLYFSQHPTAGLPAVSAYHFVVWQIKVTSSLVVFEHFEQSFSSLKNCGFCLNKKMKIKSFKEFFYLVVANRIAQINFVK